jgi:hypothetical protein
MPVIVIARVLLPVVLLAAASFGLMLPAPAPRMTILAETTKPDGNSEISGKVGDLDFTALIDRVTNQPNAGRIVKIEIVDGNRKVVAEYQRDPAPGRPHDRASSPTTVSWLKHLKQFLGYVNK